MRHLKFVLKEGIKKLKKSEEYIRRIQNSDSNEKIIKLEQAEIDLEKALNTYKVSHFLSYDSIKQSVGLGLKEYNRGLFKVSHELADDFFEKILYHMHSEYSKFDLVGHYDSFMFNPIDKKAWNKIKEIKPIKEGEKIAIYARKIDNFESTKKVIEFIGRGFIGYEVEIPLNNQESDVEKIASFPYQLDLKKFSHGLVLNEELTSKIAKSASEIPEDVIIPDSIVNNGKVSMIAHLYRGGIAEVDAKDIASICMLNGKKVSNLNFIFQGGYVKDVAYFIMDVLGLIKKEDNSETQKTA